MSEPHAVLDVASNVSDAVVGWLEDAGPQRLSGITGRLVSEGLLDDALLREFTLGGRAGGQSAEFDQEALAGFVLDELGYDDRVWATGHDDDPWLASTDALTSELVLTHRLTGAELDRQAIFVVPDLVTLDYRARAGLDLVAGGTLRTSPEPGTVRVRSDERVLEGPDGWLARFSPGEMIAFRRRGTRVTVEPAGDLSPDDHVVRHLQEAAAHRIPDGGSEEAFPMVLDAMTTDAEAFRRPVRPLGELLQATGLERRGFSWGRRGTEWVDANQRARQFRRSLATRQYRFDRCCLAAYDRVVDAVSTPGAALDRDRLANDLAHGWVALAATQEVLDFPDFPSDSGLESAHLAPGGPGTNRAVRLEALARDVTSGPASAAGLLVLALAAARRGEAETAEAHLRHAREDDPGYQPAARELVRFEIDRGDLDAAVRLMAQAGPPFPDYIAALVRRLHDGVTTPYRKAGRNQPCPCGSGRKYKACCLRSRRLSPRLRGALLDLRLAAFAHGGHRARLFALTSEIVAEMDGDRDAMSFRAVETDIQAFEGGQAQDYLTGYGALLPEEDRAVLRAAIDEPRRLWEIAETGPDDKLTLRDPETDRSDTIYDPIAATPDSVGVTLLWRIVQLGTIDYPLGYQLKVEPDKRDELRKLLATHPTAQDLLDWYHKAS